MSTIQQNVRPRLSLLETAGRVFQHFVYEYEKDRPPTDTLAKARTLCAAASCARRAGKLTPEEEETWRDAVATHLNERLPRRYPPVVSIHDLWEMAIKPNGVSYSEFQRWWIAGFLLSLTEANGQDL